MECILFSFFHCPLSLYVYVCTFHFNETRAKKLVGEREDEDEMTEPSP